MKQPEQWQTRQSVAYAYDRQPPTSLGQALSTLVNHTRVQVRTVYCARKPTRTTENLSNLREQLVTYNIWELMKTSENSRWDKVLMVVHQTRNYQGIQFSRLSWLTGKPRKLNLRNKKHERTFSMLERPSAKIRLQNLCRWSFCKNWIPRKFLAIWYLLPLQIS